MHDAFAVSRIASVIPVDGTSPRAPGSTLEAELDTTPQGVTWNFASATFTWWGGQVSLPVGFTYQVDRGADTFEGHFTSADGKLIIRHDIGEYAGAWASRDKSFSFHE